VAFCNVSQIVHQPAPSPALTLVSQDVQDPDNMKLVLISKNVELEDARRLADLKVQNDDVLGLCYKKDPEQVGGAPTYFWDARCTNTQTSCITLHCLGHEALIVNASISLYFFQRQPTVSGREFRVWSGQCTVYSTALARMDSKDMSYGMLHHAWHGVASRNSSKQITVLILPNVKVCMHNWRLSSYSGAKCD
jgi:hypothetical protein